MAKPFDVTLKSLLEDAPEDWPRLAGVADPHVTVIDADIATISGAADKVLRLEGPARWLMHFEFQSGPDASLPARTNLYSAALEARHQLPVQSVMVLLSPRAHLRAISGAHESRLPNATQPYRVFHYQVIRVWELPVETLLQGGLGQMALAPISNVRPADLDDVVQVMKQRTAKRHDRARLLRWWTAVFILMGLRYDEPLVEHLLQGVMGMEESVTYQAIVRKGMAEGLAAGRAAGQAEGARQELRKMLLTMGAERFGTQAPAWAAHALEQTENLEHLEALAIKLLRVDSWDELLPGSGKTPRRKKKGT